MSPGNDTSKYNSMIENNRNSSAITDSHVFFWDIVELSPDAIAVHQDEKWIYINSSAQKLLGLEHSSEILDQSIYHFIHPAYHEVEKERIERLSIGQPASDYLEEKIICPDGRILDVEVSSALLTYRGKPAFQFVIRDISIYKETLSELQSSESRYKLLFEFAPDAYYISDLKGNILDGNKAFEQLTGYTRSDLLGKNLVRSNLLLSTDVPKAVDILLRNSMGESTPPTLFQFIKNDGSITPFEVRAYPIRIKSKAVVLGIARDISERVTAEKNLIESEAKFRMLSEAAFEGVILSDQGKIIDVNQSLVDMLGYERQELIGMDYHLLFPGHHHDERAPHLHSEHDMPFELSILKKDNTTTPAETLTKAIPQRGRVIHITAIRDVSERKKIENLRENTEHILLHDIKNPLNAILGFAEILLKRGGQKDENHKLLQSIQGNSQQIISLIDRSLDFLKMEAGVYSLNPQAFNLTQTLDKLHKDFNVFLEDKSLTINYLMNQSSLNWSKEYIINAEFLLIENLLANLIKNAIEASPKGKTITISITDSTIQENDIQKPAVNIDIHNLGAIPHHIRDRFFEQFVSSGKNTGSGLGTFSAMLITRVHNGEISFTTSEEDGTHLKVLLPR